MPLSIATSALVGIRGAPVEVEVDVTTGIPAVRIVGLPDTAVGEARERIRSAIRASGFTWPARRITVNLAPAHLIERRAPHLLTDRATRQAWLSVCAASVHADDRVSELSLQPSGGVPPIGGLRGAILQRLESAGVAGLAEGGLLDLSRGAEAALPAALTLLAAQGLIEQRGGRWRGSEGAVLRSRA